MSVLDPRNPPVFPSSVPVGDGATAFFAGVSLRDWFAGQAMNGLLAATAGSYPREEARALIKSKARSAYAIADAMLAARNEEFTA